jgi:hypothetical protein
MRSGLLNDPNRVRVVSPKRRVGLTPALEARLKAQLRRISPSEPWVEAQIKAVEEVDGSGRRVSRRYHDTGVFPPGGAKTAMVRCPTCGIYTPPGAIENEACLDHAEHAGWGPSPSAVAIRGLQYLHLRLAESELPSESISALRREILQTMQKGEINKTGGPIAPTSKVRKNG